MNSAEPETPRRGRPRNTIPVQKLDELTIPQALQVLRELGRDCSRALLQKAIRVGHLRAYIDDYHHDRLGQPLMKIFRKDLDLWRKATLRPLQTAS